jgi:hypothetical protein
MTTMTETVEEWQPPTESLGRVPLVTPGKSGDKHIEGDFPLDQVVIDREYSLRLASSLLTVAKSFLQALRSTVVTDTGHPHGP